MTAHRLLFATAIAMIFCATAASAGGFNLAWNDCFGAGGATNKVFACNTNVGSSVLIVSFDPPEVIPTVVGGSAVVDLATASTPLPSWWRLGAGGCRDGALHLDLNASSQTCADAWSGAATGSYTYEVNVNANGRARIKVSWGMPEALAAQVEPGTEYFAFSLIFDKTSSVGLGSCPGCADPACLVLDALWLYRPAGMAATPICNPLNANFTTWQGGAIGGIGCPGGEQAPPPPSDCLATPAIRRSWGLVKSLYR